jgi:hypothetical protein
MSTYVPERFSTGCRLKSQQKCASFVLQGRKQDGKLLKMRQHSLGCIAPLLQYVKAHNKIDGASR